MKRVVQAEAAEGVAGKRVKIDPGSSAHPSNASNLLSLLDFSGPELSSSSIAARFDLLSESLLRDYRIVLQNAHGGIREEYDILELEFYLVSGEHSDPFTHGSEDKTRTSVSGRWQFHKAPRKSSTALTSIAQSQTLAGGYRGGTRKGMDITMGALPAAATGLKSRYFASTSKSRPSPTPTKLHGGILLRTIRRTSDSRVISGPSLLVDELLRASQATNIADLVQNKWLGDLSIFPSDSSGAPSQLFVSYIPREDRLSTPSLKIYRSPRVGLDLSNPSTTLTPADLRIRFVSSPYRAFVHPHLLTANGRGHSFLGVLWDIEGAQAIVGDTALVEALASKLALKPATVATYLDVYRQALKAESLQKFIGQAGKGAGSSPATVLKLVGAVRRYLIETSA